jgi:hypothetical protein
MRCKKLNHMGNVAASLKHNFREQDTPNADPARIHENDHMGADNTDAAMGRLRDLLPDKRRKDAVVCVEYVLTASPDWWEKATPAQQNEFFKRSMDWLKDKYGEPNIVAASIHRDEKTPHMAAFVAPITKDGRLSAKEFIGNKSLMSKDQSSFAAVVRDLGLERGIEGSKAKHQRVQRFYDQVNRQPGTPEIKPEDLVPRVSRDSGLLGALRLSRREEAPEDVAERLTAQIKAAVEPVAARAATAQTDRDRASQAEMRAQQAQVRERQEREKREKLEKVMKPFIELATLSKEMFLEMVNRLNRELLPKLKEKTQKQEQEKKRQESRGFSR